MRKSIAVVLIVLTGVCGCDVQDLDFDIKLGELDSDVAVPLGTSTYTMRELFEEISTATFDEDPETTLLSLTYTSNASYTFGGEVLTNGDTLLITGPGIDVDFFETLSVTGIEFGNPVITFDVNNGMPFDVGLDFSRVNGETAGGQQTFMTGRVVRTPPTIESSGNSQIEVNSGNSNINAIMASSPNRLNLDLGAIIDEDDAGVLTSVPNGTQITADVNMFFPMEVLMDEVETDFDFDLDDGLAFDEADSVSLRIVTDNELPFAAEMDLYILSGTDTLYQALDSQPLVSPFINTNGEVVETRRGVEDVPLSGVGLDALNTGDRIVIIVRMTTPQSQTSEDVYVQILARYALQVSLGVRGILNVKV